MFGRQNRFRYFVLLGYTALVLFTGFLHTERDLRETKDCPACNFLRASIGTAPAVLEIPVVLYPVGAVEAPSVVDEIHTFPRESISRAPPAA